MRTGTSSSELLLGAKCRALLRDELLEQEQRRQKLIELGYKAAKKKKPRRTCKQRLTFYATSSLALVAISGGCALLFLVPLYVDPAFSTLTADFFPEPVICTTSKREDLWGLFNCTWSSCREGCTSEVYRCTHIYVTYTPWSNASSNSTNLVTSSVDMSEEIEEAEEIIDAVLLVNIKGCGYPPVVDCENFTREMGYEGSQFPCYYSRVNRSIVMADYDREAELTIIIHYFAAPLVMTLATTAVLCVMHCDCRCQPPPRRRYPARRNVTRTRNNEISEHSISTRVERRGRPIRCECGEVARPSKLSPRRDEDTSRGTRTTITTTITPLQIS
ncbi:protein tipE [Phymastichus coffea]|uniref:protein tipE n=1 Tax=Phymastichus coffea TaxID=108790 RepID=UPI00273AC1E0|nr:protein tipE [Phymastichus coffea]